MGSDVQGGNAERAINARPDGNAFWRGKHVIAADGAGFLGSFVVKRLKVRRPARFIVPRRKDHDLRKLTAGARTYVDEIKPQATLREEH